MWCWVLKTHLRIVANYIKKITAREKCALLIPLEKLVMLSFLIPTQPFS